MTPGIEAFVEAMKAARRDVEVRDPIVIVLVDVPLGLHRGKEVLVGADPPTDFPIVPPHWVHLPDSIELSGGGKQASELGAGWARWSRPNRRWVDGGSPASQWLAHIRSLFETAVS